MVHQSDRPFSTRSIQMNPAPPSWHCSIRLASLDAFVQYPQRSRTPKSIRLRCRLPAKSGHHGCLARVIRVCSGADCSEKRTSHHVQLQGNYVFSKTLGTGEDFFGLSEPGNPLASLKLERAPVQND